MNAKQVAIKVSSAASAMIKDAVSTTETGNKRWFKASDTLYADGIRYDMLTGAGKVADVSDAVKAAVVLGFTVAERKLLASDAKAMGENEKKERKVAQQKIGRYVSLIQKYLKEQAIASGELEADKVSEGEGEGEGEAKDTKLPAEKLKIVLETALKIVQGDEKPDGYDPVIMVKLIGQAIAIIK